MPIGAGERMAMSARVRWNAVALPVVLLAHATVAQEQQPELTPAGRAALGAWACQGFLRSKSWWLVGGQATWSLGAFQGRYEGCQGQGHQASAQAQALRASAPGSPAPSGS